MAHYVPMVSWLTPGFRGELRALAGELSGLTRLTASVDTNCLSMPPVWITGDGVARASSSLVATGEQSSSIVPHRVWLLLMHPHFHSAEMNLERR
jgi:hypothetical protein